MGQRLNLGQLQAGQRLMPQMQGPGMAPVAPPGPYPGGPVSPPGGMPAPVTGGVDPTMQMPNDRMPLAGPADPIGGGGRPPYGPPPLETPPMPLGQQRPPMLNQQMLAQALAARRGPYG